ncbi:MAG TPA: DUF1549 domain-containing protein [Lacipirellulaceae bacterium]|nr:DUF1549 domain-containing protein [Lacipirellulaceae bacterium]
MSLVAAAGKLAAAAEGGPPTATPAQPSAAKPMAGAPQSLPDDAIVALINRHIRQGWADHGVRPAETATDGEWCRRVYLDVIGRIPSVEELDGFLARRSRTKRAELVDRLLGAEYREEFARHWTTVWTNLLVGRTGGADPRSATSRQGLGMYLSAAFLENKPYVALVRELVTATGDAEPGSEDFNGAVNFLIEKLDEGGVQATAKTAQLFLGMSVQCTQCHDHPFSDARQNMFWELNAFFRQTAVERNEMAGNARSRRARLVDADFAGEGKALGDQRSEIFLEMRDGKLVDRDRGEVEAAPIFYELRNGQMAAAFPAFVDGTRLVDLLGDRGNELGNSGRLATVDRRAELAKLIQGSPQLELAAVNRLWAHYLGYGFTTPVDDMGPHNPATHPELLAELGQQFRSSGFDQRRLMRWIVLSEAYGLSSRGAGPAQRSDATQGIDDPTRGQPPRFSRFYVRQMQPEQLYESLLAATQADAGLRGFDREAMKLEWLAQMISATGNDEGAETTTFNGSIPQTLMMMNGDLVQRACATEAKGFLASIAGDENLSDREKIRYLYRAALGRLPGDDETRICNELLAARGGDVVQTLQDVWWALLNSGEFILVH